MDAIPVQLVSLASLRRAEQHIVNVMKGVAIHGVAGMKFVLNGREAFDEGTEHWTIDKHGFALLRRMESAVSAQTFQTPTPYPTSTESLFKFPGVTLGASGSDTQPTSWTTTYYKEVAEMCKIMVPEAEAALVAYHVLRKSDVSFDGGKYAVAPREADSEAHRAASQLVKSLNTINLLTTAERERFLGMLADGTAEGAECFLSEVIGSTTWKDTKLHAEVLALLRDDPYYDYLANAKEALSNSLLRNFNVPPKDPSSRAHQLASQIMGTFSHIDYFPEEYRMRIGGQLHTDGAHGAEVFLSELVSGHCLSKAENPHALMPEAGSALQDEVLSLLRESTYYDFLARARCVLPIPGLGKDKDSQKSESNSVAYQPPALGGVHTDVSAEGYLAQFRAAVSENCELGTVTEGRKRRVLFLKFWRNIADSPILNHHLAMLDKSSLNDSDVHEGEIDFKGISIKQNRLNGDINADRLQWVYFPAMLKDEVICFQQGDLTIHGPLVSGQPQRITFPECRQDHATFHSAFEDPSAPLNADPRRSIEVAAYVFLPEEPGISSNL